MTPVFRNLTTRPPDDEWRTAIHESGHAIAAVLLEKSFDWVKIGADEYGEVEWTHDPFDDEPVLEVIRTWQTFYAAGEYAELLYFGEIRRYAVRIDQVLHLKMDLRRREGVVDEFEDAITGCTGLIDVAQLQTVATQLMDKKQLDFDTIAKFIDYVPSWER